LALEYGIKSFVERYMDAPLFVRISLYLSVFARERIWVCGRERGQRVRVCGIE